MGFLPLAAALLVLAQAPPVSAQPQPQFTFQVPVSLERVHADVSRAKIECVVYAEDGQRIGDAQREFDIPDDRAFNGTITVWMSVRQGQDPAAAHTYQCFLHFHSSVENAWLLVLFGGREWVEPARGTEATAMVGGELVGP